MRTRRFRVPIISVIVWALLTFAARETVVTQTIADQVDHPRIDALREWDVT